MSLFSPLKPNHKEAIGLLQIGTFLEYFDLMLYVHLAVVLNELFFPKTDPHTSALLAAFAFCSTYVLRPFGAIIFGYIGDNIGRKSTVIITTMLMSLSCIVMANVPTYAQIGITASWAVTLCRVIQGLSSMGEIVAAEIYLTETIKPPYQYPAVGLMACSSAFGTMMALAVAMIVFSLKLEWRLAFWFGASIAVIGTLARTRLRETPEFLQSKKFINKSRNIVKGVSSDNSFNEEKSKTSLAFFLIYCAWPVCFYFVYVHCSHILQFTYHYSATDIIKQNFFVSIVQTIGYLLFAFLSYYIHPLRILKYKLWAIFPMLLICPYLLSVITSGAQLFYIQNFIIFFAMTAAPAMPVFIKRFPVFKRFTYTSFIYALTRASMYVLTSFGLVYLTEIFGHWGLWLIFIPCAASFWGGIKYFEKLENLTQEPTLKTMGEDIACLE
ncbi:MFS transporter [Candidatus Paracaedibacter symbiosus]|uniref:MFS transporter n=1 Tax=Candidatus Paracaedibacter symbiosus TaxID=244582 RepID=UPI000509B6B8|nr:MFS transporter [Candidatus Paracaedibacter symbiosus]